MVRLSINIHFVFFLICISFSSCRTVSNKLPNESVPVSGHPLSNETDLDWIVKDIGDAKIVMIGDATHGTREFYSWRASLTKKLLLEKDFKLIAIEGDWADSYLINDYIKDRRKSESAQMVLKNFDRWPVFMWANNEMKIFVEWLKKFNADHIVADHVSFYGLDLFSINESVDHILTLTTDPSILAAAKRLKSCISPYTANELKYTNKTIAGSCAASAKELHNLIDRYIQSEKLKTESHFLLQQISHVALNGENYLTSMARSSVISWNIRDQFMTAGLKRLLQYHSGKKIIVWAHNSHVADARYTNRGATGRVNLAQLTREEYGKKNCYLIGMGFYSGTVMAGTAWHGNYRKWQAPLPVEGSVESVLHQYDSSNKIYLSRDFASDKKLNGWIRQRVIGAVFNGGENYLLSKLPDCYDAYLFFNRVEAIDICCRQDAGK